MDWIPGFTRVTEAIWGAYDRYCQYLWQLIGWYIDAFSWLFWHFLCFCISLIVAVMKFCGLALVNISVYGLAQFSPSIHDQVMTIWTQVRPFTSLVAVFIPVDWCLGCFYLYVAVVIGCAPMNFIHRWAKGWL